MEAAKTDDRRNTFTTWGFGYPPAAAPTTYRAPSPPIAPSPSTGNSTLVTPSTGRLKKGKDGWGWGQPTVATVTPNGSRTNLGNEQDTRSPIVLRPESEEMVVVTYEEGLAKLGLSQPHHIITPDPPGFDEARQAYPVPSPRTTPGRSGLRNENGGGGTDRSPGAEPRTKVNGWNDIRAGVGKQSRNPASPQTPNRHNGQPLTPPTTSRPRRHNQRSPLSPPDTRQDPQARYAPPTPELTPTTRGRPTYSRQDSSDVPLTPAQRVKAEAQAQARARLEGRKDDRAQSSWLPSYYHTPDRRHAGLPGGYDDDGESDLGYMDVPPIRYGHRI